MLTKPEYGWTDFSLNGSRSYGLSYLDDIAFDWITQAIHGLETMLPFCVKGFMEPGRMLCVVSFWNCYILTEQEDRPQKDAGNLQGVPACADCFPISMIAFCKDLYKDISENVDAWASFVDYGDRNPDKEKQRLLQLLEKLKRLIAEREQFFSKNRCFL